MQLDNLDNIENISLGTNFAIFEAPKNLDQAKILPKAIHVAPTKNEGSSKFSIKNEQIKNLEELTRSRQTSDMLIVIEHSELLVENAANTFLKSLEEPNDRIHYIFLVDSMYNLLPTIRSRAQCYYVKSAQKTITPPNIETKRLELAKSYLKSTPEEVVELVNKVSKQKESRDAAIELVNDAIEVCYKAFFMTGNQSYLKKLENLIKASESIQASGNIKLQLIAAAL